MPRIDRNLSDDGSDHALTNTPTRRRTSSSAAGSETVSTPQSNDDVVNEGNDDSQGSSSINSGLSGAPPESSSAASPSAGGDSSTANASEEFRPTMNPSRKKQQAIQKNASGGEVSLSHLLESTSSGSGSPRHRSGLYNNNNDGEDLMTRGIATNNPVILGADTIQSPTQRNFQFLQSLPSLDGLIPETSPSRGPILPPTTIQDIHFDIEQHVPNATQQEESSTYPSFPPSSPRRNSSDKQIRDDYIYPHHDDEGEENLIVASPVVEAEQQQVEEVTPAQHTATNGTGGEAPCKPVIVTEATPIKSPHSPWHNFRESRKLQCGLGLICCCFIGVIIVGAIYATTGFTSSSSENKDSSPTLTPATFMPSVPGDPNLDYFVNYLLPEETRTLLQDPESPQSLALEWLKQDPNLLAYKDFRRIQRFALATFYYSTRGGQQRWANSNGWLSVSSSANVDDLQDPSHECTWFSTAQTQEVDEFSTANDNICDEDGQYIVLSLVGNR